MYKYLIAVIIGAGLMACSAVNTISVNGDSLPVTDQNVPENKIDSLVKPYAEELEVEMSKVIAVATGDFTRGRPNGTLNNWAASATLTYAINAMDKDVPTMALLNVGGLRNPISQGDVTIGDMFKLMPFDNEVVWVKMPKSVIPEIEAYLRERGGEPMSGAKIVEGRLELTGDNDDSDYFHIITSDYLLNGGDHMDFFQKAIEVHHTGSLLRDAFIAVASAQGQLVPDNTEIVNFD